MTKRTDYFRLLCSPEYKDDMAKAIEESGYNLRPFFPLRHLNSKGEVVFWIFELDIIFDIKNENQHKLLELQDKYLVL